MVREGAEGVIEPVVRREDGLAHEGCSTDELVVDGGQKDIEVDHAQDHSLVVDDRRSRDPGCLDPGSSGGDCFVGAHDQSRLPSGAADGDSREQRKGEAEPL
jgi:hypothetical protein